jgi:hypothetical protein
MAKKITHWIVIKRDIREDKPTWQLHRTGQGKRLKGTRKAAGRAVRAVQGLGLEAMGFLMERPVPPAEILAQRTEHPAIVVTIA